MRVHKSLFIICAVVVTIFGPDLSAESLRSSVATVLAPAGKFCLLSKVPSLSLGGFLTASSVEKAFEVLTCFAPDSAQAKAYTLLVELLYSRDYGQTITSLRGNNAGIIAYFSKKLRTDDVFYARAESFYADLAKLDQDFFVTKHPELIGKIPNLGEVTGQGAFVDFPPGWLWTLAMRHANQDAMAAVEIIGLCGHDDVNDTPLINRAGTSSFSCPRRGMTLFYTAQSIGMSADVEAPFKQWVGSIEAPSLGLNALPSKTYHVYGGLLFSCLMKSRGLSDPEIEAANSIIAKLYRVVDMRNRIMINKSRALDDPAQVEATLRESCRRQTGPVACPDFKNSRGLYAQDREDRFVAGKLTEFDSYVLIDRWGLIKKLPLFGVPLDLDLELTAAQMKDRPEGWSQDRFDRALKRIATYRADIEWTDRQHVAGAKFGSSVCAP